VHGASDRRSASSGLKQTGFAFAGSIIVIAAVLVGSLGSAHAGAPTPQINGSVAAPTPAEASPICDAPDPSDILGPSSNPTSDPTSTLVSPTGGVLNFTATATDLYVDTGSELITYTLSGHQVSAFALPTILVNRRGNEISQPVIDPSGNIYIASYYDQLVDKFSPSGQLIWSVDPEGGNPTGLFSVGTGSSFKLAVSVVEHSSDSAVIDLSTGAVDGSFPFYDYFAYVTQESSGNLLVSGNGYVQTIDTAGSVLSSFGSSHIEGADMHTGSGSQFYYPGQAVQATDGTIFTADPSNTIEATSPQGFLEGATTLGHNNNGDDNLMFSGRNLYLVGSTVFYQGGSTNQNSISTIPESVLAGSFNSAHVPDDSLGWGAGLSSSADANYFAPGTTPAISASFDPWWTSDASKLELSYSVENTTSLDAETVPPPTTIPLPTTSSALSHIPLTIPAADQQPGPYLVQASLFDTSSSPAKRLGTTCMPYTVGATGDGLNLATLPSGIGAGGPGDSRGVALNAQLGLDGFRGQTIDWGTFLPNCSASHPTEATCSSSAMTFSTATTDDYKAAYLAQQDHVTYWLQASGGSSGSVPSALVADGWWQADVTALVRHYATVPPGCGQCAPVTKWEPWNEPNNTGWGSGAQYVSEVLKPFYDAVKSVLPGSTSTVVGGSSLSVSVGWWQQVIAAGGLHDLDVASIHPYPGNNDSFEEDGIPAQVEQLKSLLGSTPLWFTEVGWWSDGDYNFLNQANAISRAMIWQKVLGVPVWNYYFDEGNWGNDGVSSSLIQTANTDDYVKPAALATMATTSEIGDRAYRSMPTTGIPQTYEASFGATPGGSDQMAAVWSDGLDVTGSVKVTAPDGGSVPVTVTSEYGENSHASVASGTSHALPISDQVTYLTYPIHDTLTIGPTEDYGTNLALLSEGATASASSGNASSAIDGLQIGYDQGWSSAEGDTSPSLTVDLSGQHTINRIVVDTQSVGSVATSVRDYTVSVDKPSTGWTTVADVVGQYRTHELQLAFDPVTATAIKLSVSEINFGGYYGGGVPPWWSSTVPEGAFIHALQVYAGSDTPAKVGGTGLAELIAGDQTPPPPITTPPTTPPRKTTKASGSEGSGHHSQPEGTVGNPGGYWLTSSDGAVYAFGGASFYGSANSQPLGTPIVGMEATPDHKGYRMVGSNGAVFAFGDAGFFGSVAGLHLDHPIVGLASTPDSKGYWLVGSDGGIFALGNAGFYGSTGALPLNKPIVGMASTPDGKGYWLVASDGGIFSFGDADFYGSTGALSLNKPIVGMASTPDGKGYWLVASDGGIFAFGDAGFYGSTGALPLNKPIVGMASTPDGKGYWLVASDGGIFSLGDAAFYGSAGGLQLAAPAVAIS
jgi:hypothetical protein